MQKVAETLHITAKWTGGRVVDCSGLENLAGNAQREADLAFSRAKSAAQDALFAMRSDAGDGTLVGTSAISDDLREWLALEQFDESDPDTWMREPEWCGFYDYCPLRFLAYLVRFGPLPGEGKALPPRERPKPMDQTMFDRLKGHVNIPYTYFALGQWTGRIKIGKSIQPGVRMGQLAHDRNGERAKLLATIPGDTEKAYHRIYWQWHEGHEWFAPHPDILAEIERLNEGLRT